MKVAVLQKIRKSDFTNEEFFHFTRALLERELEEKEEEKQEEDEFEKMKEESI